VGVVTFVSMQTGINHHLRYVLGGLPLVYLLCGASGQWFDRPGMWHKCVIGSFVGWSVLSSLSVYPHSLAYFNELVGGPERGRFYLDNSNIDWGQDFLNLKRWVERHPDRRPLMISFASQSANPPPVDWDFQNAPTSTQLEARLAEASAGQPILEPGWYMLCVTSLISPRSQYEWLSQRRPSEQIGWSILVFELTHKDVQEILDDLIMKSNQARLQ
jgi:hypothetical protein